ncbi:TetR/AcrR family transcriptional regulator [Glutamicibacter sp. HZAU]|uniref:TetR/AcrR family transcriptional regulator n=1 Tax=Glutamicibacter sp. HZAU TaxID=2049891 RepID=UPI000FFBB77D|nr:TetR/AcrR family transcriptional regulator [Glutamicibacter sp. HZAU]RWZ85370.1 TetR family transcriptional regulator [Glutamicibacter sp. HZAU]
MPRINAPTVAEHRRQQMQSIMDATFDLLHETAQAPTLAQVARQAGMSRTAIYQYFKSPQELLQAAAREVYPRWIARVREAVDSASSPREAVLAYAIACIDQVAEGGHAVGTALASLAPEEPLDEQAEQMHASARLPLTESLEKLGVDDPEAIAELVTSVIHAAGQMVDNGTSRDEAHQHLQVMLGHLGR